MDDLARRIEADKTRELVGFVAEGKCASIARAVVAGGNARAILRDRDECAALGVETGSTLLHVAVRGGFVSASKLLISQGADPSIADDAGMLPIHHAAAADAFKVVEAMLDAATAVESARAPAAVVAAVTDGRVSGRTLFPRLVDPRDARGRTPVLTAAYAGEFAPVMILAEMGASLAAVDDEGRSAMAAAAEGGHTGVCEVLASMRAAQLVKSRGIRLKL
ncbi:hypothetical protein FNF29_03443 [Cafeteria roenbergensis]|uniref:Uncharacterized protein n=1 Tax=Cafeteria roenbergensis TaxID=33653 RepID=A0A5A8CJQ3_CAFRO|nr:hypothetical protein FNF29_03443 [Cafeteria roenbergensis]|eukprot:KAA0152919.1 hypothetical protein FNF29_03443 [Cafeteria roenbergensis]